MSIQVPITPKDYRKLRRLIVSGNEVVCMDHETYVKCLLIGRQLLMEGKDADVRKIKLASPASTVARP